MSTLRQVAPGTRPLYGRLLERAILILAVAAAALALGQHIARPIAQAFSTTAGALP